MKPKQNLREVIASIYPNLFIVRSECELVEKTLFSGRFGKISYHTIFLLRK